MVPRNSFHQEFAPVGVWVVNQKPCLSGVNCMRWKSGRRNKQTHINKRTNMLSEFFRLDCTDGPLGLQVFSITDGGGICLSTVSYAHPTSKVRHALPLRRKT